MVAEQIDEDIGISPAHEGLVLKLACEMVRTEAEAEERAALTDDARRLIPMRLVKMVGAVPRMTAAFENYLMALPLENPLLTRLKAEQPTLYRQYATYLGLRRGTRMTARGAQWVLAKEWGCSDRTVRTYLGRAEALIVGYVRERLTAELRRRRAEIDAGDMQRIGPRMDD